MGSVCSRDVLKTLKSEVSRSFSVVNSSCIAEPLRCDPNRGQRRVPHGTVPPRCDPTCGQRGEQCSSFSPCSSPGGGIALHHSPECGTLDTSGSLRKFFSSSSSSVGPVCSSLASGSRSTFASTSMAAGPSSSTSPMLRSGVRPNLRHLRGERSAPSRKLGSACSRDRCVSSGRGAGFGGAESASAFPEAKESSDSSFSSLFVRCMSPSQRVAHVSDCVTSLLSTPTRDMHINSCGSMHGSVMHDNSSGMHVNSCGALGHKNSCHVHAAEVRGGTKAKSTSTRLGVRCPAVEELASPQQAPGSLHGEVWASILQNQGPKIFREVEIIPGCAATVACPSCPDHSPEPPGPGRIIRNMLGWSLMEKNEVGCGVWLFRGALQGKNLFSSLDVTGDWVRKGSYHTAWAVPCDSLCSCSYSYGQGPAIGPHTGRRCWPLLEGVWRAIAPLMKPWCAEVEVPTAANLNLYRGGNSCVGWHRDDELLFGECGEAKLIVSVSLGGSAVFRWKRRSCPDDEGHLCCLGHGDILVMDGRCQDKFLHRTDPCREQERINITFRWIKQHVSSCPLFRTGVACCLPTCAQGLSVPVMGNSGYGIFWVFWLLFCVLCAGRVLALLASLLHARLGFLWCASCWTRLFDVVQWGALPLESLEGMSGSS